MPLFPMHFQSSTWYQVMWPSCFFLFVFFVMILCMLSSMMLSIWSLNSGCFPCPLTLGFPYSSASESDCAMSVGFCHPLLVLCHPPVWWVCLVYICKSSYDVLLLCVALSFALLWYPGPQYNFSKAFALALAFLVSSLHFVSGFVLLTVAYLSSPLFAVSFTCIYYRLPLLYLHGIFGLCHGLLLLLWPLKNSWFKWHSSGFTGYYHHMNMSTTNTTSICLQQIQHQYVYNKYNINMSTTNTTSICLQQIQHQYVYNKYNINMSTTNTTSICLQQIQHQVNKT